MLSHVLTYYVIGEGGGGTRGFGNMSLVLCAKRKLRADTVNAIVHLEI